MLASKICSFLSETELAVSYLKLKLAVSYLRITLSALYTPMKLHFLSAENRSLEFTKYFICSIQQI